MSGFSDREKAFETQFAQDDTLRFKVVARRNKLFGLWAAEKLGEADADAYAKTVVAADFDRPGDDDVLEKVAGDFAAKGISIGANELRAEMDRLLGVAKTQIAAG
ncbi:MAG: DUF1476 domain-containing protein [Elstera sp.]|jgi:hypothetical protein